MNRIAAVVDAEPVAAEIFDKGDIIRRNTRLEEQGVAATGTRGIKGHVGAITATEEIHIVTCFTGQQIVAGAAIQYVITLASE